MRDDENDYLYIEERDGRVSQRVLLSFAQRLERNIRDSMNVELSAIRSSLNRTYARANAAEIEARRAARQSPLKRRPATPFERDAALIRRDGISTGEARRVLNRAGKTGVALSLGDDDAPLSRKARRVQETIAQMVR